MPKFTATSRIPHSLASHERDGETLLCCCEVDLWRHAAPWGYAWLNFNAGSANSAGSHSPRIPLQIDVSTKVVASRSTTRSFSWKPAARNPRPKQHRSFKALSLGTSGERAFCFSVEPINSIEYRASRALSSDGRKLRDAGFSSSTHLTGRRIHAANDEPRSLSSLWSVARTQARLDAPLHGVSARLARLLPACEKNVPRIVLGNSFRISHAQPTFLERTIRPFFSRACVHVFRSPERNGRAAEPGCPGNFGRSFVFGVLA